MKRVNGVNPDYADYDELDQDALDIVEEFYDGSVTYAELKAIVGAEHAEAILAQMDGADGSDPEKFFDNPEDF